MKIVSTIRLNCGTFVGEAGPTTNGAEARVFPSAFAAFQYAEKYLSEGTYKVIPAARAVRIVPTIRLVCENSIRGIS